MSLRTLYAPAALLTRAEAEEIARRALRASPAPETRVSISSTARADTRFALNQVTTSGENQDTQVTITAYAGNRAASVNTNRLDEASARLKQPEFRSELRADLLEAFTVELAWRRCRSLPLWRRNCG